MAAETIFALASGAGVAGVAVVRVSGPRAREALERLCGDVPPARMAVLRTIADPRSGQKIDSGLILFFPGPASFTGEDVAELQVHGSRAVVRDLLRCLGDIPGLRAAQAGEFTERAFRNGRMDLLDVEALGDLLAAETLMQARFAHETQGRLRQAAQSWRGRVLELRALTEAYIDFADEDDIARSGGATADGAAQNLVDELKQAIASFERAEKVRRGFRVAILGAPNAGKSSLLNALARRDVAIVSEQAGTTRDVIEVHLELDGYPVILFDTAGIRETEDAVEREGIRRARERAADSDLRLWLSSIDEPYVAAVADCIVVRTKRDLIDSHPLRPNMGLAISVRTGDGIEDLMSFLIGEAGKAMGLGEDVVVGHERQRGVLIRACEALCRFLATPADALEIRSEELRQAETALEALIGRIGFEDVLGEIFSRFCIGK